MRRDIVGYPAAVVAIVGLEHFASGLSWGRTALITAAISAGGAAGLAMRRSRHTHADVRKEK
jgi:hypothetical protein